MNTECIDADMYKLNQRPKFPEKKWFGNKELTFLNKRKSLLEKFFLQLIFDENFNLLLDSGKLKDFFFNLIWSQYSKNNFKNHFNNFKSFSSKVLI